jgi:Uncharacterized protein conserved in bacteria
MPPVCESVNAPTLRSVESRLVARYLIDANLPRRLTIWHTPDFEWVSDHDDRWSDSQVWDHARLNDLIIVTKDADFSNRVMLSAPPPRVVHLRLGNQRIGDLRDFLMRNWPAIAEAAEEHKLTIVTPNRMSGIR